MNKDKDLYCTCFVILCVKGHKHIRIDGKTPPVVRQSLCDQFQHDQDCLVAVLSITTANAGVRTVLLPQHVLSKFQGVLEGNIQITY